MGTRPASSKCPISRPPKPLPLGGIPSGGFRSRQVDTEPTGGRGPTGGQAFSTEPTRSRQADKISTSGQAFWLGVSADAHLRFDFIRRQTYGIAIIMAKPRIFIEEDSEAGVYHALSRAVDGNDIFADTEARQVDRPFPRSPESRQVDRPFPRSRHARQVDRSFPRSRQGLDNRTDLLAGCFSGRAFEV